MKKIFVVDDNTVMLRLYNFHLAKQGWTVECFESGAEAIAHLPDFDPDVAILDYDLKDMMGTDVYKAMKEINPAKNIPVIFITAQIRQDIKRSLSELDNATVLDKPFSPAHLIKAIEDIFSS